ncbi:patatin-like phospholipase family protein [Leisingera daeponensis]|uniref:Patatin-like phospholipase family protein n=1 Tax=Leisingera daeponensis TaxID=405746 RepID=A0ABS7NHT6_9RHOB|nr:patatin-like phospholipase family protein [Leisingera daeponensis]MBY6140759.1 patatin-like phospholipase family protein [Leisingera daeponensis]
MSRTAPPSPPAPLSALVLQGGGARGAYQTGAIRAIAEITGSRRSPFGIVCGASVGAINAASLAAASQDFQAGARHLESLWQSLRSSSVYDTRTLPLLATGLRWALSPVLRYLGVPAPGGFLDHAPLGRLLEREYKPAHLRRAIRSGALHAFCITASSYSEGTSVTYFEGSRSIRNWQRVRRRGERALIGPQHLLASAALPLAFAPVALSNGYFGDGSLRLGSPLSPAIHCGARRILVISTRDRTPDAPGRSRPGHGPGIGEVAGHVLDILFNDNLEADYERLTRINRTVSLLGSEARKQTPLREIEALLLQPSQDLRTVARAHAARLPRAVGMLMRGFGALEADGRIESYLMFEPDYIGALISAGYTDTMARAAEIRAFFGRG